MLKSGRLQTDAELGELIMLLPIEAAMSLLNDGMVDQANFSHRCLKVNGNFCHSCFDNIRSIYGSDRSDGDRSR